MVPSLFDTRGEFHEDNFSIDQAWGMVSGWFKHIIFIMHFISTAAAAAKSLQSCPNSV